MMSPISRICGVNSATSNRMTVLAVFCIWSMVLSIDAIRSRMLPRSNGVMKVRRTAISTSRVTSSASCSRSMTVWQLRCDRVAAFQHGAQGFARLPARPREWRANSSKKRSSFGIKA